MTDNELNALVAERVMGLTRLMVYSGELDFPYHIDETGITIGNIVWIDEHNYANDVPDYANEIAAAFQVVEHFQSRGFGWRIQLEPDCRTWRVCNHDDGLFLAGWKDRHGYISETATTAPRAICLAALMAVGVFAVAIDTKGEIYFGGEVEG